jgi:DNA-binding NtrC family response regulator
VEGFFEQSRVHYRVQDVRQNIPWMELGNFMSESTKRLRVLVIDDEPLIGLSVEMMLSDNGFDCVGVIGSLDEALVFVNTEACDAAILDLNLSGASSAPVAAALQAAGVPFVIVSGYSAQKQPSFSDAEFVQKPFSARQLLDALNRALERPKMP